MKYTIIYGHRRFNAFKKLGKKTISAFVDGNEFKEIPLDQISIIGNTRTELSDLSALMADIKQNGLLQPIGVTTEQNLDKKGWLLKNLSENICREDLKPIELYKGLKLLRDDFGLSVNEISVRLSLPILKVNNLLNLGAQMPEDILDKVGFALNKISVPGTVPFTTANRIWGLKIADADKKKIFAKVKKELWPFDKINQIESLLRGGVDIEEALENIDEYTQLQTRVGVRTDKLKKIMADYNLKAKNDFLIALLKGQINEKDLKGLI